MMAEASGLLAGLYTKVPSIYKQDQQMINQYFPLSVAGFGRGGAESHKY